MTHITVKNRLHAPSLLIAAAATTTKSSIDPMHLDMDIIYWTVSVKYLGVHIGGGKNLFFDTHTPRTLQTDGRTIVYSEHEHEYTFANKKEGVH